MPVFIIVLLILGLVITGIAIYLMATEDEIWGVLLFAGIPLIIISVCCWVHWEVRQAKTPMFNSFFGTNYTTEQLFWGGQMIYDLHTDYEKGKYERKKIELEGLEINIGGLEKKE